MNTKPHENKAEIKAALVEMVADCERRHAFFSRLAAAQELKMNHRTLRCWMKELAAEGLIRAAWAQDDSNRSRETYLPVKVDKRKEISDKKYALLSFIRTEVSDGKMPTFEDMKAAIDVVDSTISRWCKQLVDEKLLKRIKYLDGDSSTRIAYVPTERVRDGRKAYNDDTAAKKAAGGRSAAAKVNRPDSALGRAIPMDEGKLQQRIEAVVAKAQQREAARTHMTYFNYGLLVIDVSTHGRKAG